MEDCLLSISKEMNPIKKESSNFSKKCPKCKSKNIVRDEDEYNGMYMILNNDLYALYWCDECGYEFGVLLIPEQI